ncbi:VgrG-related protein [Dactylosporangium sp. NPDC049525]|uniref:VgrG-related protein n=1 Tax=Dactylosporangium sp. NPDC049525 TaxID=3154730 RepID=UPI00342693C0
MMPGNGRTFGARPIISVDGRQLEAAVQACVRQVTVDSDEGGPDSCRVVFDDPARDLLRRSGIDLHATVEVSAGRTGEQVGEAVFEGLVYHLGFEYDDRGAFTTLVAYDGSYGLYNGVHTTTYQNVADSDLATQLARAAGLKVGTITPTSVVHDHLAQVNETHWQLLTRRAREIDFTVRVVGGALDFMQSAEADGAPEPGDYQGTDRLALVPGGNLEQLSARVSAAQQVAEVEVRGWDPEHKRALVATAPARTRSAKLADEPDTTAGRFGTSRHVTVDLPLTDQAECDAVAAAQAERLASTFVHAEGVARGDPRIVAGAAVSLGRTGGRFDGKVTVSRARHMWDHRGYRTSFTVSGRHDRSLLGLVTGEDRRPGGQPVAGLVVGIVTNVADPDARGRVKLRLPWLSDDYESDWVRVLQLGAGADRGLVLLPEVDDEVLVGFEQGDTRRPYVLGGLYNGVDPPPVEAVDTGAGVVNVRAFRSRKGHEVLFTDTDGTESIAINAAGKKVTLVLDAANKALRIEAEGDVEIHAKGNAKVTADKDFTLHGDGKGTVSAGRGLTLDGGSGDVVVTGTTIKLN